MAEAGVKRLDTGAELRKAAGGEPRAADTRAAPTLRVAPAPGGTPSGDTATSTKAPAGSGRKRTLRRALFALLPFALVLGGYEYVTGGAVMSTENAYVRADMVGVSTDISGIVRIVEVADNQRVAVGDVLFRFDDRQFRLALDKAEAQLGIVRTQIEALKASYRDMQAQIAEEQVSIDFYRREFDRQKELVGRSITTQATFEAAQRNLQGAQQKLASLQQQLAGIVANLGGEPDLKTEDHPRFREAIANRDEAARQLSHTVVSAPIAGIATNVPSVQPGMYLAAATASVSIVATDHVWVEAMPKETELTWVRPGQIADVSVDTYPGVEWKGTVESISPASGSSFSLLPAQNTTGNWVKVVQRIPMRVRIETPDDKPPLRAGMSVEVEVETGHARGLPNALANLFGQHASDMTRRGFEAPVATAAPEGFAPAPAGPRGQAAPTVPALPRPANLPHG